MENRLVESQNGTNDELYEIYIRLGHANLLIKAFAIGYHPSIVKKCSKVVIFLINSKFSVTL